MFPFDDSILLCVFTLGTETFSGYVRHRNEQCHLSHDRELIFVTSVKNVPKCLTLSTLGTHLVVFMSVIVHASHWYQAHNIMREIRSKAKAILPPNTKPIPDGTKTNSVGSSISSVRWVECTVIWEAMAAMWCEIALAAIFYMSHSYLVVAGASINQRSIAYVWAITIFAHSMGLSVSFVSNSVIIFLIYATRAIWRHCVDIKQGPDIFRQWLPW